MVKRLISANASEVLKMSAEELKQSIKASEGRVVLSENVAGCGSFIGDVTNAELARAYGADMILLNGLSVLNPFVAGLPKSSDTVVEALHKLVGTPVGVNLEPVDLSADMAEDLQNIDLGRQANEETFKEAEKLGFEFICLTGNPGTGVTNEQIKVAIKLAKKHYSGLIIAGKMHGAGVSEAVITEKDVEDFISAGADIILTPAVGTVPGFDEDQLKTAVKAVHAHGGLVMSAIGTSQEGSDIATIRDIALRNKICGVDIQHIGDAGYSGVAPVENIYELSKVIRGVRHTVSRVARSVIR